MISERGLLRTALLFILTAAAAAAAAQGPASDTAERVFTTGVSLFRQERYAEARASFLQLRDLPASHRRTTAAAIMAAKCALMEGEDVEAARALREFLQRYPASLYAADAEYMQGLALARLARYDEAVTVLRSAWRRAEGADSTRLARNIRSALEIVLRSRIPPASIAGLAGETASARERALFLIVLAERELAGGNIVSAGNVADSLDRTVPGHPYGGRLAAVRAAAERRSRVKVGVLVPLMSTAEPSAAKEVGNDVYDGLRMALEEHSADPGLRVAVDFVVKDTDRNPIRAEVYALDLVQDPDVVAILGPVFSQTTQRAAAAVAARGIPLLSPTANANGIAAMGPAIFQANPDYEYRGRAMARYAVEEARMTTLAVLAPSDAHGRAMGEAFIAEAGRLGVPVAASEWYSRDATDLSEHFLRIRQAARAAAAEPLLNFAGRVRPTDVARLVQAGVPPGTVDSLLERAVSVRAASLLGPRARRIIDSLQLQSMVLLPAVPGGDSGAVALDGLYIPIATPGEIGVVSAQVVYHNITTRILGSGEWYALEELDANKRYCTGVIFESDWHEPGDDPAYGQFRERFQGRFGKPPGRNALYGYDTARLLLALINSGASTRAGLTAALGRVGDYPGYHSRITLRPRRVNSWLSILQFDGTAVRHLMDLDAGAGRGGE